MDKLLNAVKTRLGITGTYSDDLILALIDDVKEYCVSAGVNASILLQPTAYGMISMGVNDLWAAGAGNGTYSDLFVQRVIQMALKDTDTGYTDGYSIDPQTHDITLQTAGKDMMDNITVKAVTAAIDSNIKPENIKIGVTILGVEGIL